MRSFIALSALPLLVLGYCKTAAACSGAEYCPGDLFPRDGRVPADQLQWTWTHAEPRVVAFEPDGGAVEVRPALHVFVEGDEDTELLLEQTETETDVYTLTPTELPAVGSVLRVEQTDPCGGEQQRVFHLEVIEPEPAPASIGELEASANSGYLDLDNGSAGCTGQYYTRYVDLELYRLEAASNFEHVFRYSLLVDGEAYASPEVIWTDDDQRVERTLASGPLGRGQERVFALCDDGNGKGNGDNGELWDQGLTPGVHRIQMVGLLPDGTLVPSNEIEVDLSCTACSVDGGIESCTPDAGPSNVGSDETETDGAAPNDIETDAAAPDEPETNEAETDEAETDGTAPGPDVDNGPGNHLPDAAAVTHADGGAASPAIKPVSESDPGSDSSCAHAPSGQAARSWGGGLTLFALALALRTRRRATT